MFRRERLDESEPDPALPFLTVDGADRVRSLTAVAFAEHGLEVTVHADHVRDSSGRLFGLWNVATVCHQAPRGQSAWPRLVRDHVRRILAGMDGPDPFLSLTREEAAARTYARIYPVDGLPNDLSAYPYEEFAPGLVQLLALDLPDTVRVYQHLQAQLLGGVDYLRAAGITNLRKEKTQRIRRVPAGEGGHFNVLDGDSVYTASRALLMPNPLGDTTLRSGSGNGWLLSVPNRHQVCWHLIEDLGVVQSIKGMAVFARLGYNDSAGQLSPHVFWWDGTGYRQLTEFDTDGNITVHAGPEFARLLERLPSS